MSDASQFPITFGYKATDGYYYGPNGTIGAYHRGEDRAMPDGTPVIVNGVTIGLSNNTGASSGSHLHIGRFVNGQDTAPNGGGFNFASAVVTEVNQDSTNGKYVRLQADGASWVYLHLLEQRVAVGQVLNQAPASSKGGDMPIPDQDNYYWRWGQRTAQAIRGRQLSRDEFSKYIAGQDPTHALEILEDDPEAQAAAHALTVGQLAVKDDWQSQIYGLQDQLKASQDISTKLNETLSSVQADDNASKDQLKAALAKASDLTAELQAANDKLQSTVPSTTPSDPGTPVISKDQQKTIIDSIKALWHKLVG